MAKKQHSELVAGLFIVVSLAAALGVVLWLGGTDLFSPAAQEAWFYTDIHAGATGLMVGAEVFVGSTRIGQIAEEVFQPERGLTLYRVDVQLEGIPIHNDATAIAAVPFLGTSRLVITDPGSPDAPLADRDTPVEIRMGGMAAVMSQAEREFDPNAPRSALHKIHRSLDDVNAATANLKRQLDPDASPQAALLPGLLATVGHLRAVTGTLQGEMDRTEPEALLTKVHGTMDNFQALSAALHRQTDPNAPGTMLAKVHGVLDDVRSITTGLAPRLESIMANVAQATQRLQEYMEVDVAALLVEFRDVSNQVLRMSNNLAVFSDHAKEIIVLNRENIEEMIDNMAAMSAEVKAAATEIRRSPWKLVRQPDAKEVRWELLQQAARDFSNGAEQLDQALAKLRAVEPGTVDPNVVQNIREHLQDTFRNFKKAEDALWTQFEKVD